MSDANAKSKASLTQVLFALRVVPLKAHNRLYTCIYICASGRGGPRAPGGDFTKKGWRRRPDLNRGWRFCRPLPYHLATAPVGSCEGVPAASQARRQQREAGAINIGLSAGLKPCATHVSTALAKRPPRSRGSFRSPERTSAASEPRERSGDRRAPVSERVGGSGGAKPPGKFGAGNGIRTRDFDLGKVAL